MNKKVFLNGKCAVFEEMEVKGKNMPKKYKSNKYNNMKKSYKLNSFTLWGVLTFLVMMFGISGSIQAQQLSQPKMTTVSKSIAAPDGRQVSFTVSGQMPAGSSVTAIPVQRVAPQGKQLYGAYDITIAKAGKKWQPKTDEPAMVTITDPNFVDGTPMLVYHEGNGGLELVGKVVSKNGAITFPAQSFSVYIVTETGGDARLEVVFKQANGASKSIFVKANDVDAGDNYAEFNKILFDPGAGTYTGLYFRGWYMAAENYTYTVEDEQHALTIAGVRDSVRAILGRGVTDGDQVFFHALLYNSFMVTYLDQNGIGIGSYNLLLPPDETLATYTVFQTYTPASSDQNLEGWYIIEGASNISSVDESTELTDPIPQNTQVKLTGDVVLAAFAPFGQWLVFDENGKNATYNSPQFVRTGEVTSEPFLTPVRFGYTFGGWYTQKYSDSETADPANEFEFGQTLSEYTTIYAKWIPNTTADYTIIIWKQNLYGTGYDFDLSINSSGTVGDPIGGISQQGTGDNAYIRINGVNYTGRLDAQHDYTGFHLDSYDQNVEIVTEGTSVVNIYYKRNLITLNFYTLQSDDDEYIYTLTTKTSNGYYYIPNDEGGYDRVYLYRNNGRWYFTRNWLIIYIYSDEYTGEVYDLNIVTHGGEWTLLTSYNGLYGSSIIENDYQWPSDYWWYDNHNTTAPTGTRTTFLDAFIIPGGGSVKNFYGNTPGNVSRTIHFLKQNPDGNGYTEEHAVTSAGGTFSITDKYNGFKAVSYRTNNNNNWTNLGNPGANGQYASVSLNNVTDLYIRYDRLLYSIAFMDGMYIDGNGNPIEESNRGLLKSVAGVAYGEDIASYNEDGDEYYHPEYAGFVLEGWYLDNNCSQKCNFTTLPAGGLTIYAKWRQIQYRVFLHSMADGDNSVFWGSDEQKLVFRVDYGGKIGLPTGTRTNYEFVGWYRDEDYSQPFNINAFVMNDDNVTTPYDKTTDFTDPSDKWGNANATWNSDIHGNTSVIESIEGNDTIYGDRFWITRKLELYGKWRKVIEGADGIGIEYAIGDGTNAPSDTRLYLDNTEVVAGSASTAPEGYVFSYWEIMSWDETEEDYVPSGKTVFPGGHFTLYLEDARRTDGAVAGEYNYNVRIVAHYEEEEKEPSTFIVWYTNDGSDEILRQDGKVEGVEGDTPHEILYINEAVEIPTPDPRDGYTFMGWYKKFYDGSTSTPEIQATLSPEVCAPNFLYYNNDDNKYYSDASFTTEATQVAADEANPYDYLYAIWKIEEYDFDISEHCVNAQEYLPTVNTFGIEMQGTWTDPTGATVTMVNTETAGTFTYTFTPDGCADPIEVEIVVKPTPVFTITPEDERVFCEGGSLTLTAVLDEDYPIAPTFDWMKADDKTHPSSEATLTVSEAGGYMLTVDLEGCFASESVEVTMITMPSVSISGDNMICAGNTTTLTSSVEPADIDVEYQWSLMDDAGVQQPITNATDATYDATAAGTYSLEVVTTVGGCTATSDPFEITEMSVPTISMNEIPESFELGCNPESIPVHTPADFTVNDESNPNAVAIVATNGPEGEGCAKSQTWTATYSNDCGSATPYEITYTWIEAMTPEIVTELTSHDFECGEEFPGAPTVNDFTVGNACENNPHVTIDEGDIEEVDGCLRRQTWTANYEGTCENAAPYEITYTWMEPQTPVISTNLEDHNFGCDVNFESPTVEAFVVLNACEDNPQVELSTSGIVEDGCTRSLTWTASYTSDCGSATPYEITYTWIEAMTPEIVTELTSHDFECGEEFPGAPTVNDFTVGNACENNPHVTIDEGDIEEVDGCLRRQTWTANYEGACENAAPYEITYTWTEDNESPVIVPTEFEGIPAGNCQFAIPDLSDLLSVVDNCSSVSFVSQYPEPYFLVDQTEDTKTVVVTVVVEDACGNPTTTTIDVRIPAKLSVVAEANPTTVFVNSSAELTATTSDELGTVTYEWTPAASLDVANAATVTATPTVVGENTYTVTATDENGCEASDMVTVNALNRNVTVRANASKVYDGTPLEVNVEDITIEGLNEGDYLDAGTLYTNDYVVGVYTCPDNSFQFMADEQLAIQNGFVIKNGDQNVTANYTPTFDVTLSITAKAVTITAASDSKQYDGTALTNANVTATGLVAGDQLVAQVSGSQTEVGTSPNEIVGYTITRNGRDVTGSYSVTPVNGTLTVFNANIECEGVTYQGHDYPAVQIGNQCWLAENLRNTVYGPEETTDIADFAAYNNEEANMEKFGYLYTWYSTVCVPENNDAAVPETLEGTSLVQGICPEGWVVPSQTDFDILYQFTANEARRLRDMNTMYWIPGEQGVEPNYHFNSRAGGFYNSVSGQFERMLFEDYYWTSTSDPNTTEVTTPMNAYYCNSINFKTSKKSDKRSVRCISVGTAYNEIEEPEFRCGVDHLPIGENSYETVQIGTQCWTKTNLRETKDKNGNDFINGLTAAAGSFDEYEDAVIYIPTEETWNWNISVPYDENTLGYFYNWTAAQDVCPDGWHLPSDEEWTLLEDYVSNAQDEEGNFLYRCDPSDATSIAKALASETSWSVRDGVCYPGDQTVKPNNTTGFSAVPAGAYTSSFVDYKLSSIFWSSSSDGYTHSLYISWAFVTRFRSNMSYGFSVRCLRDAEE